jgi:TonB family protein
MAPLLALGLRSTQRQKKNKNMRPYRITFMVLAAVLLSACATSYQAGGLTGGYTEKKISDSAYVVTFGGNGFASKDRVYYFWLYRCAELTLQNGFGLFQIRANQAAALPNPPEASIRPAVYRTEDGAQLIKTKSGGGAVVVTGGYGGGATKWTYSGTVLMYQAPLPPELVWAVDAHAVIEALQPYIASNGTAQPPSRGEIFKRGFTAHARVDLGDDSIATAAASAPDSSKPPRFAAQIAEGLETNRLVDLHAAFRFYAAHLGSRDPSGNVVLEFSISPNGQVTDCRVASTTFSDAAFAASIANLVQQTDFGPRDVIATTVKNFRITFAPI